MPPALPSDTEKPFRAARQWAIDKTWIPQMDADQRIRLCIRWKKAVSKSFDWV
jgi:glycerol kinase